MSIFSRLTDKLHRFRREVQLLIAPATIDEAVDRLLSQMTPEDIERYKLEDPEWPRSGAHFCGGMAMRNNWGLWEKTGPLNEWFRANGLWHGDDKSALIYRALYCRLVGATFDIDVEKQRYIEHWKKAGLGFDGEDLP